MCATALGSERPGVVLGSYDIAPSSGQGAGVQVSPRVIRRNLSLDLHERLPFQRTAQSKRIQADVETIEQTCGQTGYRSRRATGTELIKLCSKADGSEE